MDNHQIIKMKTHFDGLSHTIPDENVEFWFARELQEPLGYAKWERFNDAIQRAIVSCETTGTDPNNHFRGVTKMVKLGSGAERAIEDYMLTRYASYLIAQNGDHARTAVSCRRIFRQPNISMKLRSGSRARRRCWSLMAAMQKGWLGRMGSDGLV